MSQVSPVAEKITALQQADSAQDLLRATQELAASADASAAPVLVEVLGFNNPGAAVAAVEGLISLGTAAVDALLQLDPENYGARAWAVRALAGIGDVRGLELLLDALGSDVAASVRRAAAKGLGQMQLAELPPDQQQVVQRQCLGALLAATSDGEWVVRYAVAVGLELLAAGLPPHLPEWQQARAGLVTLLAAAADNAPVVQRRAHLALLRLEQQ
ncbi:MAG: HEAT repeat domain-containing protein [Cyanobacteria bacterium]|nr:HEAT repeat domain-containing protein [Cyanobacteria bacterium bin.275]